MKILTSLCLFLLFLTGEIHADASPISQDSLPYPFNQMWEMYVKPYRHKMPTYYVSGYAGGFFIGEDVALTVNASAGIQFNKWVGIGIAGGGHITSGACCASSFTGIGVQYRLLFPWHVIWSFDYGLGLNPSKGNDYYNYYRPGKPFTYYKLHVGRRFGNAVTLGGCIWNAQPEMENWDNDHLSGPYYLTGYTKIEMPGFALTIGFNIH